MGLCVSVCVGSLWGRCLTTTTTTHHHHHTSPPHTTNRKTGDVRGNPVAWPDPRPQILDLRPQTTDSQGKGPSAILYLAFFVGAAFSFSPKTRIYEIRVHRPGLPRQQNISICDCFEEFAGQLRWAGLAQNVLFGRPKPHAKTQKNS